MIQFQWYMLLGFIIFVFFTGVIYGMYLEVIANIKKLNTNIKKLNTNVPVLKRNSNTHKWEI